MRLRFVAVASFLIAAAAVAGCSRDRVAGLGTPQELTLYSLDGRDFEPGEGPKSAEQFHCYPVLGKVEVEDADRRKAIVAALKAGVARSDGFMAKCFWPRHGIRTVEDGNIVDFVICFECLQLHTHAGSSTKTVAVSREPQAVLNDALTAAGVPLAPGAAGEKK